MSDSRIFGRYNDTNDYIQCLEARLDFEPVGFFECVNCGTGVFQLMGRDFIFFLDRCILRLLSLRARPCVPGFPTYQSDWVEQPKYGTTSDEIHRAVMAEWIANGAGEMEPWTGVWFGLPKHVTPLSKAVPLGTR